MIYKERLKKLCCEQTNLTTEDTEWLLLHAQSLMESTNYASEDVFIDVRNAYSENATVVFHKKPTTNTSLYAKDVVGDIVYLKNEPGVIRTLTTGVPTIGLSAVSQEGIRIQQTVFPIFRGEEVLGVLILEKRAYEQPAPSISFDGDEPVNQNELVTAVQDSHAEPFSFLEHLDDAILIFDHNGCLKYFNRVAVEMYRAKLGYMDSIENMAYDNLVLGHTDFKDLQHHSQGLTKSYFRTSEIQYGLYYFLVKQYVIAETQLAVMVCKDITSNRQIEEQLLMTETVMREMHHRVKNNLQTVVSLLRLQAQRSQDEDVQKSLYASINRILSIAVTHDLLSTQKTGDITVEKLLKGVIDNVRNGRSDIQLTHDIDSSIYLDSSRATSVALIVNELLQNSYAHAFQQVTPQNPQIHLQVNQENDIIKIIVTDNGSGYDTDQVFDDCLGLIIVESFVKSKLSGRLAVQSDAGGTTTAIMFKYQQD